MVPMLFINIRTFPITVATIIINMAEQISAMMERTNPALRSPVLFPRRLALIAKISPRMPRTIPETLVKWRSEASPITNEAMAMAFAPWGQLLLFSFILYLLKNIIFCIIFFFGRIIKLF